MSLERANCDEYLPDSLSGNRSAVVRAILSGVSPLFRSVFFGCQVYRRFADEFQRGTRWHLGTATKRRGFVPDTAG